MSNLKYLLKIEILKFLSSFNSKNKKKVRQMPVIYVGLLIALFAIGLSSLYSFLITYSFVRAGANPAVIISLFAGIASLLTFFSSMNQARGIYIGEDYDILTTLPIKKKDIVASKVITLYTLELIFSVLIMLPCSVVLLIMTKDVALFLIGILVAFTIPIVPIAFSILVSLVVTMLTAKFKSANVIFILLSTLFVVGLSLMGALAGRMSDQQSVSMFSTTGGILKWINPSYIFLEMAIEQNYLWLILYVAINIIVMALSLLFITLLFDRLHEIVTSVKMSNNYVRKNLKNKKELPSLLSLEFKRLFNSRLFFMNGVMGAIMGIVGPAIYLFIMNNNLNSASQEAIPMMKLLLIPIFIAVACMVLGISNPTNASISIEGKNFWIIKSLPINYKKYMWAKLLFPLIIYIPASLISSTIAVIFFHENALEIVMTYLIPLLYVLLSACIGLISNMKHIKLKWSNETEVVKNSAAIVMNMLIDLAISLVLTGLMIAIPLVTGSPLIAYIIAPSVLLVALIPCFLYINSHFVKTIENTEDF